MILSILFDLYKIIEICNPDLCCHGIEFYSDSRWSLNLRVFNVLRLHNEANLDLQLRAVGERVMHGIGWLWDILKDLNTGNNIQGGVQVGAIFITVGLVFICGIMKVSKCGKIKNDFTDSEVFENEVNIIDNLEQNQFYFGEFNRESLFQNKIEYPSYRPSGQRGSQQSYN